MDKTDDNSAAIRNLEALLERGYGFTGKPLSLKRIRAIQKEIERLKKAEGNEK